MSKSTAIAVIKCR